MDCAGREIGRDMDILLDSNVIIELEGPDKILPESVAEMVRLSHELGYRLYSHPCQFDDLNRDSNENRRRIQLSKLKQYPSLVNPPLPNQFELLENGWGESSDNDRCDNLLLFAVKRSAVRFLITEDRRMHTKARRAGIGEQVFFIEEFLALLRQERARQLLTSNCAQVVTRFLYELDVSDSFFDSLRLSYKGFDSWFNRCASEKRRAWAVEDGNRLSALCVFKEEKDEIVTDANERLMGRSLKLCTFKVSDRGKKLGERLLFVSFKEAVANNFDYVYVQVREYGQDCLIDLLLEYGFVKMGTYHDDVTYVKDMRRGVISDNMTESGRLEYDIMYYPHFLFGPEIKKFVVPIKPDFHDRLFPDLNPRPTLFDRAFGLDSEANAIKKAYICRSPIKTLRVADLLFFYSSHPDKAIKCVGFVEAIKRSDDPEEIASFVSKRTVYSQQEIKELVNGGEAIAILFRVVRYLQRPISSEDIKALSISWPIQTICSMSDEAFNKLRLLRNEDFI